MSRYWWMAKCPKCAAQWGCGDAVEEDHEDGARALSLRVEDSTCPRCGHVLTTGDDVSLMRQLLTHSVVDRVIRIPEAT